MPINPQIPLGATMAEVASPLAIVQMLQQNRRQNDAADALAEERRANTAVRQMSLAEAATRQQDRAEAKQQNATLDELMKTALVEDPTTGVASYNRSALEQGVIKAGLGHRVPALTQTLDALDESARSRQAEGRKAIALAIRGAELAGGSYEAALGGLAYLRKNGMIAEGAVQPALEALEADPSPAGVQRVLQGFGGRLPEYQALVQAEAAKKTATEKAAADLAHTQAQTAKLQSEATQGPPKHFQSETMLVNGRPAPVAFDPATARYFLSGVDVTDKVQPVPPREPKGAGELTGGRRAELVKAILANPDLYDRLTPTLVGEIAPELATAGFGFGKPLSEKAITTLAGYRSTIASVRDLREVLKTNEQYIGPIAGLAALNPYSDARKAQSDIDRVKQRVGKILEGGVLRKEDEEKYKKILSTLTDTPSTALYKTDQMIDMIENDLKIYADEQRAAGRRTEAYVPTGAQPGPARLPVTIKGDPFKGQAAPPAAAPAAGGPLTVGGFTVKVK